MATEVSEIAVNSSPEVLSGGTAPTQTASTPAQDSTTQKSSAAQEASDAVKVLLNRVAEEKKVQEERGERVDGPSEELAEQLRKSLNSDTALKFHIELHGGGKGPGYISSFNFQIVDKETGKVVRQFPPEEMVKIHQVDPGLFVDSSA